MVGKRICILIAAAILLTVIPLGAKELPDVVAVVNGEKISKDELTRVLIDWNAPMALDQLIMYRLVGQEARKAGVNVTVDEVKARMEDMKKNVPPGQDFNEFLRRNGMTEGHFFAYMKMTAQAEQVIRKQISIGPEELANYRKASHILIRTPGGADQEEKDRLESEAKAKVEKIVLEIQGGKSFEDAAKEYSEDPMTKEKGGDLDFFSKGEMMPDFEKATFELEPGQMSEPVKTSYGWHIIKFIKSGDETSGEERKALEEKIAQKMYAQKYQEWMLSLRNKAQIDNKLEPPKPPAPAPTPAASGEDVVPDDMPPPPPPEP